MRTIPGNSHSGNKFHGPWPTISACVHALRFSLILHFQEVNNMCTHFWPKAKIILGCANVNIMHPSRLFISPFGYFAVPNLSCGSKHSPIAQNLHVPFKFTITRKLMSIFKFRWYLFDWLMKFSKLPSADHWQHSGDATVPRVLKVNKKATKMRNTNETSNTKLFVVSWRSWEGRIPWRWHSKGFSIHTESYTKGLVQAEN